MRTGTVEAGLQSHSQPKLTRAPCFQLPFQDLTSRISKTLEPVFLPILCDLWSRLIILLVIRTLVVEIFFNSLLSAPLRTLTVGSFLPNAPATCLSLFSLHVSGSACYHIWGVAGPPHGAPLPSFSPAQPVLHGALTWSLGGLL